MARHIFPQVSKSEIQYTYYINLLSRIGFKLYASLPTNKILHVIVYESMHGYRKIASNNPTAFLKGFTRNRNTTKFVSAAGNNPWESGVHHTQLAIGTECKWGYRVWRMYGGPN